MSDLTPETPEEIEEPSPEPAEQSSGNPRREWLIGGLVLVVAVIALVVWLSTDSDDDEAPFVTTTAAEVTQTGPFRVSEEGMRTLSTAAGEPIYWMGPLPGHIYELTQHSDGKTYLRYLPAGTKIGERPGELTIIATYPYDGAFDALGALEGERFEVPGGGTAVVSDPPTSVYVAFPDVDYQIEVYDPSAERAREIAASGDLEPVVET